MRKFHFISSHRIRAFIPCLVLLAFSCSGIAFAIFSEEEMIRREPLADKEWAAFRTLTTLHRMPTLPKTISRNGRINHGYYDETLFSPDATVHDEMAVAREIGLAAVAQETGMAAFMAEDTGLNGIIMANMAPLMLARYDTNPKDSEGVANYLEKLLDEAVGYSDRTMKIDGKTVFLIFNSYMVSQEHWKQIRAKIETKDRSLFLMHHAHVLYTNPALNRSILQYFDGAFIWGGSPEQKTAMANQLITLRKQMMGEGFHEFPIMMTADPGYWRPEAGMWRSRSGTEDFRKAVRYIFENRLGWMLYESWDDIGENTLIQPSIRNHTTLVELAAFYAHLGNGKDWSATAPGLLSAHPVEVLRGRSFDVEIVQLPVENLNPAPVYLVVRDASGAEMYRSAELQLDPGLPEAVTITLPSGLTAQNSVLCLEVERGGETIISSSYIIVRENRLHDMHQYQLEAARLIHPKKFDFTINGKKTESEPLTVSGGTAQVSVVSDEPLRRIELVRNGRVVGAVDALQRNGPLSRTLAVFWDAPVMINSEKYSFGGQVSVENGQIMRGFVDRLGTPMTVEGSVAKWQVQAGILHGVATLVFSGDENTRFNFSFPGVGKEFSATWKEIIGDSPLEFSLTAHSAVRLEATDVPSGLPELLNIKEGTYSLPLPEKGEFPVDAYHIRLIGDDFRIARSSPILIATDKFKSRVESTTWIFDREEGRIEPDQEGLGYFAELGGSFERNGGYDLSRMPARKDGTLVFDGVDDVVALSPNLLPQAGARITLRVRPDRLPYSKPQTMVGSLDYKLSLTPEGKIEGFFGERGLKTATVNSSIRLKAKQWYNIELVHDNQQLTLYVDGKKENTVPLDFVRQGVVRKAFLGAEQPGTQLSPLRDAFAGAIDFIQITAPAKAVE